MIDTRDDKGNIRPDKLLLNSFGKFMRAKCLDKLRELWNVLNNDMNLLGPRPLLLKYTKYYSNEQTKRLQIKPGIIGWALVNGRNAISWEKKFINDTWYVENKIFWLDLMIIWLTIKKVIVCKLPLTKHYSKLDCGVTLK
jgi:lipopolysaccharide/colanic/teichoic acid biosynthesis glycosyltransferase